MSTYYDPEMIETFVRLAETHGWPGGLQDQEMSAAVIARAADVSPERAATVAISMAFVGLRALLAGGEAAGPGTSCAVAAIAAWLAREARTASNAAPRELGQG